MVFDDDWSDEITQWYLSKCALSMQGPMRNSVIENMSSRCYKHWGNYRCHFPLKASFLHVVLILSDSHPVAPPVQADYNAGKQDKCRGVKVLQWPLLPAKGPLGSSGVENVNVHCCKDWHKQRIYLHPQVSTSQHFFSFTLWPDMYVHRHPSLNPSTHSGWSKCSTSRSAAATKCCDCISAIRFCQLKIPFTTAPLRTWTCITSRINTNSRYFAATKHHDGISTIKFCQPKILCTTAPSRTWRCIAPRIDTNGTFWPRYSKTIEWYFTIWFVLCCRLISFQVFMLNAFPMTPPSTQTNQNQDNGVFEASLSFHSQLMIFNIKFNIPCLLPRPIQWEVMMLSLKMMFIVPVSDILFRSWCETAHSSVYPDERDGGQWYV